jgi:predicted dehydrogenase
MKLKYGIIGAGGIGFSKHLAAYGKMEAVEVVAACDTDRKKAEKVAQEYGASFITDNYRELLEESNIDFVSVCLPNYLHSQVSAAAMYAGKHVHCEKPMAMSVVEAKQMLKATTETGKKLMIALNNRFTSYAFMVRDLIKEGRLGEIYHINCGWMRRNGLPASDWFANKALAGGGPFIDLGVHFVDLAMNFLGYPKVETVSACTYSKFGDSKTRIVDGKPLENARLYDVEDIALGMIRLKNEASINFEISWASNIEQERIYYEILGSKAGMKYEAGPGIKQEERLKYFTNLNGHDVNSAIRINENLYPVTEFSHFIECIENDTEPYLAPPDEGVKMTEIVDAVYESARKRREIVF